MRVELDDWFNAMEAIKPKAFLVGKKGQLRAGCPRCGKLVDLKGRKARKVGAMCIRCKDTLVDEMIGKYALLVEAGVPLDLRHTEMPILFMWWLDEEFYEKIRIGLRAVDPDIRALHEAGRI
jgi:hypothetical protein